MPAACPVMGGAVVVVVVKVDAGTGDALKAAVSRRLPSIKAMRPPRDAVVDATACGDARSCRGLMSWCDKAGGNSEQKEHRCGSRCYRASLGEIHGCPLPRNSRWKSSRAITSAMSRVADFSPASPLNAEHDP